MGIVIAYKGTLNNPADHDTLLADLRQCALNLDWPCQDLSYPVSGLSVAQESSDEKPRLIEDEVRGIHILPPGTEILTLTFNRGGKLIQYMEIPRQLLVDPSSAETYYLESTPWVKTTGEIDSHVLILVLLRRIKTRYMRDLEVEDDTGFWHSGDYRKLREEHRVMSIFTSALSNPARAQALLAAIGEDPNIVLEPLDPNLPGRTPGSRKRAAALPN